jgi:hypothetical protein
LFSSEEHIGESIAAVLFPRAMSVAQTMSYGVLKFIFPLNYKVQFIFPLNYNVHVWYCNKSLFLACQGNVHSLLNVL